MTTAQYEAKCLGCHSAESPSAKAASPELASTTARPSVCPVNPLKGCIDCHMPRIRDSASHLELTDHYIRRRPKSLANRAGSGSQPAP
jgi:formate-dependent nitrite reductase cytochrome c552 subunit